MACHTNELLYQDINDIEENKDTSSKEETNKNDKSHLTLPQM